MRRTLRCSAVVRIASTVCISTPPSENNAAGFESYVLEGPWARKRCVGDVAMVPHRDKMTGTLGRPTMVVNPAKDRLLKDVQFLVALVRAGSQWKWLAFRLGFAGAAG